jgi:GT2 family glycosyltransferase
MAPSPTPTALRASVVICVGGPEPHLPAQLEALAHQTLDPEAWELIISYNYAGGAEHPVDVPQGIRHVRHVDSSDVRGPGHARNVGAAAAASENLLFCDADDIVNDRWVEAMVATLATAEIAAGEFDHESLNSRRVRRWRPTHQGGLHIGWGFLALVVAANLGVQRAWFDAVGGFDGSYLGACEDGDLGWRIMLAGGQVAYVVDAVIQYRHRETFWGAFKQHIGYGRGIARLMRAYRPYAELPSTWRLLRNNAVRTVVGTPGPSRWSLGAHGLYLARCIGTIRSFRDEPSTPRHAELFRRREELHPIAA